MVLLNHFSITLLGIFTDAKHMGVVPLKNASFCGIHCNLAPVYCF